MRQAFNVLMSLVAVVVMATAGVSCVKEDLTKCPPTTPPVTPVDTTIVAKTLRLKFVPKAIDITPTQEDLKLAVVYVFDAAGNVVTTWTKENPALNTAYDTAIALGANTYRLVAWINPTTPISITPPYTVASRNTRSALTDGRVTLDRPSTGLVTTQPPIPMLMYGSVSQVLAPTSDAEIEIPLMLDVYKINFLLSGVPRDGTEYEMRITDTNGSYDFENNFVETERFTYVATVTASVGDGTDTEELTMNMTTLRLGEGRSPQISIVNKRTGAVIFPQNGQSSANLMELVKQTDVNLDTTHTLNMSVSMGGAQTDATPGTTLDITINGWRVVMDNYSNINPYD